MRWRSWKGMRGEVREGKAEGGMGDEEERRDGYGKGRDGMQREVRKGK